MRSRRAGRRVVILRNIVARMVDCCEYRCEVVAEDVVVDVDVHLTISKWKIRDEQHTTRRHSVFRHCLWEVVVLVPLSFLYNVVMNSDEQPSETLPSWHAKPRAQPHIHTGNTVYQVVLSQMRSAIL